MAMGSELAVNDSKMELCVFHRFDQPRIKIKVFISVVLSSNTMKVLGVIFDSKL
jgi:hypothetical protein